MNDNKLGPVLFIGAGIFLAFWALSGQAAAVLAKGSNSSQAASKPGAAGATATGGGFGSTEPGGLGGADSGYTPAPGGGGGWGSGAASPSTTGSQGNGTAGGNGAQPSTVRLNASILFPSLGQGLTLSGSPTVSGLPSIIPPLSIPGLETGLPSWVGYDTFMVPIGKNNAVGNDLAIAPIIAPDSIGIDAVPVPSIPSSVDPSVYQDLTVPSPPVWT